MRHEGSITEWDRISPVIGKAVGMSIKDGWMKRIETAVVPAAGRGSRMKPLTMFVPKEMFPLGSRPVIEHTIAELVSSGINRICVVINKEKEVIRKYLLSRRNIYGDIKLEFVYQRAPLGLGDALWTAREFIDGTPFVMALPDQILLSKRPATRQLLEASKGGYGIWNSMVKISEDEMDFLKGSRPFRYTRKKGNVYLVRDFSIDENSRMRGFGRTVFLPESLDYMTEEFMNPETGEVDLLRTFQALKNHFPLYGTVLRGRPCDIGTWEGYYFYQRNIFQYLRIMEKMG